jgi:4-amino-4-deoxy-L-arabinose transferase-like glycosyltransferase
VNQPRLPTSLTAGLLVTALAVLLMFYQLGAKDIWDHSEVMSVAIAEHMVESSEYMVPQIYGYSFIDNRPPGYYWLTALVFKLTGEANELMARVPSALAGVLCVLAVFMFGRQVAGPKAGFWASIVLLGMMKFVYQARLSEQDILLTLFTILCFWAFWLWRKPDQVTARTRTARFWWAVLLQVLVGLGAMAKGPMIILNFALPAFLYIIVAWQWKRIDWAMILLTSPIAIALALWWYLYIWLAVPHEHEQLLYRFMNQGNVHQRDWHYYLVKLPVNLGPVVLFLPLLWSRWRDATRQERQGPLGFFIAWFLGNLIVLSLLFSSKQSHYLVPAYPGLALALGLAFTHPTFRGHRLTAWFGWLITALLLLIPVGMAVGVQQGRLIIPNPTAGWFFLVASFAAAVYLAFSLRTANAWISFRIAWCFWLLTLLVILGHVVPLMDTKQSGRSFADLVDEKLPTDARLGVIRYKAQFIVYLDAPPQLLTDAAEALAFMDASSQNYVIIFSDEIEEDFKKCQLSGSELVVKQDNFMKRGITAYLLHDKPGSQCDEDCRENCNDLEWL